MAAVALHGRTAAQLYSGRPTGTRSPTLKQALDVPVLGNGDIWEADDALRMVARDRLRRRRRRPRLPGPAVAVRRPGRRLRRPAPSGACRTWARSPRSMRRHAELLAELARADERGGCTDFRKHVAWYLKGFPVGSELRRALAMVVRAGRARRPAGQARPGRAVPGGDARAAARADQLPGQGLPAGRLARRPRRRRVPEGAELDDSGG